MRITNKALTEITKYQLNKKEDYILHFHKYVESYEARPPAPTIANKNMLRALRLMPVLNTAEDWARLHATEMFLNK